MSNFEGILSDVNKLIEEGKNKGYVKAFLTLEGYNGKDIALIIKASNFSESARSNGFTEKFYNYLREAPRTEEEVINFVNDPNNSDNVRRYLKNYLKVAELVRDVRESL